MLEELVDGLNQLRVVILAGGDLILEVVDCVDFLGQLIEVFPGFCSANGHKGVVNSFSDFEQTEVILVVID